MGKPFWFLLGVALGAGIIYYLDSRSGKKWRSDTRRNLRDAGDQLREHSGTASHEVRTHLKRLGEIKDDLVGDASARGRRAVQTAARRVNL